jgi:hypothetical protein
MSPSGGVHDSSPEADGRSDSSPQSPVLVNGMTVLLYYYHIGLVGEGILLEQSPSGHWLGINIEDEPHPYVMLTPTDIQSFARLLPLMIRQDGLTVLSNTIGRAILWSTVNIKVQSEDPSMTNGKEEEINTCNDSPFIRLGGPTSSTIYCWR